MLRSPILVSESTPESLTGAQGEPPKFRLPVFSIETIREATRASLDSALWVWRLAMSRIGQTLLAAYYGKLSYRDRTSRRVRCGTTSALLSLTQHAHAHTRVRLHNVTKHTRTDNAPCAACAACAPPTPPGAGADPRLPRLPRLLLKCRPEAAALRHGVWREGVEAARRRGC